MANESGEASKDLPPTMDDMILDAIGSKRDEDAGYAIAWSLNKVAEALHLLNNNYAKLQMNQNYALEHLADAIASHPLRSPQSSAALGDLIRRLSSPEAKPPTERGTT